MREQVERSYREREPILNDTAKLVEDEIREALRGIPHVDRVSCRAKSLPSFIGKAFDAKNNPPYADPLSEIEDQVAARVIVFFLSDIDVIREKLLRTFNPVEAWRRRPARDEEFGYESAHLLCVLPPHLKTAAWIARDDMPTTIELQVRTIFMHAYAEPQHDTGYKAAHELPSDIRRELAWIAASAWGADHAYQRFWAWYEQREARPASPDSAA